MEREPAYLLDMLILMSLGVGGLAWSAEPAARPSPPIVASYRMPGDWPQFRGPDGQGHAGQCGLPLRWSETDNVRWKVPVPGRGWSSPVVLGDRIWITTATDSGRSLRAVSIDRQTGRLLYDVEVFASEPLPVNPKNSHASPTPVVEPGRLYVHFGTLGTACLDADTGNALWADRSLTLEHKEGPGSSPVLYGNLLILTCDGMDKQYVAALDKSTGRLVWRADRTGVQSPNPDFRKAYATPLVVRVNGDDQLISPAADRVIAYDPSTGKEIWRSEYKGFSNVPRPVVGADTIFVCTGFVRGELVAIRAGGQGDVTRTHEAWRLGKSIPNIPSPLLVGQELYLVSDRGVATCVDSRSGRVHWTTRLDGDFSASPLFADGRVYFFSEANHTTVVAAGTKLRVLAVNELSGRLQATPAVAGPALFLRSDTHLYRLETDS